MRATSNNRPWDIIGMTKKIPAQKKNGLTMAIIRGLWCVGLLRSGQAKLTTDMMMMWLKFITAASTVV